MHVNQKDYYNDRENFKEKQTKETNQRDIVNFTKAQEKFENNVCGLKNKT